ncbi:MAG: tetratricopeptide repeat protein [Acidobacteriota bacterium]
MSRTLTTHASNLRIATLILAVLVAASTAAWADDKPDSALTGVVKNAAGEELKGVQVEALDAAGAAVASAETDRKGEFEIELAAGTYKARFSGEGYTTFEADMELESGMKQELAVTLLDEAAGRRNKAIEAYNAGAQAHRERNFETALAKFKESVELEPTLAPPFLALADVHLQRGEPAEAISAIEAFLELEPDDEQGKKLAFEAYRRAGETDKAEAMAAQLGNQDMSKDLAVGIYNEGAVASQAGDYETALAKFRQAVQMDPSLAQANAGIAALLYNQEDLEGALAAAQKAIAIEPENRQALRIQFLVYDGVGDYEKGMPAWEAYRALDEAGAVQLLYTRADMEFQAGEIDAARNALSKVLEVQPDFPRAHYTMGLTYTGTDPVKAKEHLNKFIELAPDDPEVTTAKEILSYL